jgi:RNA polymerase sigma factor (sigma-70 family)
MDQSTLIPHLFRTEFRKITAVLCKHFGIRHIELAEDIAGETFLAALETWPYKGIPANPTAWLYTVAGNKARNQHTRTKLFAGKIQEDIRRSSPAIVEEPDIDLSESNIKDSQLGMMFAVCHPSISSGSQIGLALRVLCGLGIEEIANALLTNKETVAKRLTRAREKLREEQISMDIPGSEEIPQRLETVLTVLYLLFNEGYYSESNDEVLREDLCREAMHLTRLLTDQLSTNLPQVHALLALMCFHASRFTARKNKNGEMILYDDQDESLWDTELIATGAYHLRRAASGDSLSRYHLEAGIAYWHTIREDSQEKWGNILQLFNHLLQLQYSPVAALNRTYALSKVHGKEMAIREAEKLSLTDNHYYLVLLGELYTGIDNATARRHFEQAQAIARSGADKRTIEEKLKRLHVILAG